MKSRTESNTMGSYKINPTQNESLRMISSLVIGDDEVINAGGMSGHIQLNVFKPVMIYNLLMSARLLDDACISFNDNCAIDIEANELNIKKDLDNSLMLVTALNPHIGYNNSARKAKKAHKEGSTLRQAVIEVGLLTNEEFALWVSQNKMI